MCWVLTLRAYEGHEHVSGAVHVPPFWHGDEQMGVLQEVPDQPAVQVQVLGAVQEP